MADFLLDANILIRLSNTSDPLYKIAEDAIDILKQKGHELILVPQCFYEYWSVATRPSSSRGGLGLTPMEAEAELVRFASIFDLMIDLPSLFDEWRMLVNKYGVSGVNTHDARLVAAMLSLGITRLLTFNTTDFTRYKEIASNSPQAVCEDPDLF